MNSKPLSGVLISDEVREKLGYPTENELAELKEKRRVMNKVYQYRHLLKKSKQESVECKR